MSESEIQVLQLRDALRTLVPTFPLSSSPGEWLELGIEQVEEAVADVFGTSEKDILFSRNFIYLVSHKQFHFAKLIATATLGFYMGSMQFMHVRQKVKLL